MPKSSHRGPLCQDPRGPDPQQSGGGPDARATIWVLIVTAAFGGWGCGRPGGKDTTDTPSASSPLGAALSRQPTEARDAEPVEPAAGTLVDETQLRRAFAGAPAAHQLFLEEAVAVARTGQRAEAIEQFQKLLRHPQLTPEQRRAVEMAVARLNNSRR